MIQYVFRACWSQTDQDNYTVWADSKEDALHKLKASHLKPHHWDYVCSIEGEIK